MHTLLIAVFVIIALGLLLALVSKPAPATGTEPTNFAECATRYMVLESHPRQCITPSGLSFTEEDLDTSVDAENSNIAGIPDLITVSSPTIGASISSPLVATGSARGNWYFEASFPIEVRNAANVVIGQGIAQAQGDWMTTNFVPFVSAPITFPAQPAGSTGFVVLKKDNPSGDPAMDQSVVVPVTF